MSNTSVTSVDRLLSLFEAFRDSRQPLSLTKLAETIGMPKSSCHAMVSTLIERGYLYTLSRPRALYPTRRMHDIMQDVSAHDPFILRATPTLERLRNTTQETIILGKRQGDSVIYLQIVESPHPIRYTAQPGVFKPLHSSSIGKALLGSLKESELQAWLQGRVLPAVTARTKAGHAVLLADLEESRKRGYYVTRGENISDVWAVSASIPIHGDVFGVAVAGPQHRIEPCVEELARLLIASCSFLARQL
ncbi:IclR family transcriptional regulator [Castellaniella sp.]|uniref:IclR family transcriptional regulator n=1 Tax=Castellaniella sp. TaxID=1955812 RepID=UPI00356A2F84